MRDVTRIFFSHSTFKYLWTLLMIESDLQNKNVRFKKNEPSIRFDSFIGAFDGRWFDALIENFIHVFIYTNELENILILTHISKREYTVMAFTYVYVLIRIPFSNEIKFYNCLNNPRIVFFTKLEFEDFIVHSFKQQARKICTIT